MFRYFIVPVLLLCCGVAVADDYVERDGFYWQGDRAYTRQQVQVKQYFTRNGCRYYRYVNEWKYTFSHERPKPVVQQVPDKEPDAGFTGTQRLKSQLISLAAENHRRQNQLKENEQEHQQILEMIDSLGLQGVAQLNDVYRQMNPGAYSLTGKFRSTQGPFTDQGSTLYGFNAFAPRYSEVDLQVLFNQMAEITKGTQQLAGRAGGDFAGLVAQQSEVAGEIDRIHARGQQTGQLLNIVSELLRDRAMQHEAEINVTPTQPQPVPQSGTSVQPLSQAEAEKLGAIIGRSCVECHSPDNRAGGWDLTQYDSYTHQQKYVVVQSLEGKGPKGKQMPLNQAPLPDHEKMLFLRDYITANQ